MVTSITPSFTMTISSSGWRWAACGTSPGLSVVMWHSREAQVTVGEFITSRRAPVLVAFTASFSQS